MEPFFIMNKKLQLHHQIFIAMIAGYLCAYLFDFSKIFIPLGDIFIRLLKMMIVPIVFTSIVSGVGSITKSDNIGRLGIKTILYYLSTSLIAIFIGLFLANIILPENLTLHAPSTRTYNWLIRILLILI